MKIEERIERTERVDEIMITLRDIQIETSGERPHHPKKIRTTITGERMKKLIEIERERNKLIKKTKNRPKRRKIKKKIRELYRKVFPNAKPRERIKKIMKTVRKEREREHQRQKTANIEEKIEEREKSFQKKESRFFKNSLYDPLNPSHPILFIQHENKTYSNPENVLSILYSHYTNLYQSNNETLLLSRQLN